MNLDPAAVKIIEEVRKMTRTEFIAAIKAVAIAARFTPQKLEIIARVKAMTDEEYGVARLGLAAELLTARTSR